MPEDLISGDLNFHSIYIHAGITSTVTTSFSGPDVVGFGPQGLTFDGGKPTRRYGNLVNAGESLESIFIHVGVTSTVTTSFSIPGAAQDSGPITITVDASGNLISARAQESEPGSVRIHAGITSTVTTSFSTPFNNCRGITVDASGNLISDDIGTQSVYIHAGITSTITTSFTMTYLNGLEISEAGNLIAAKYYDPEDSIQIHAGITSTVTTSFSSPKSFPWGLTLNNPPSPDSVDLLGKADITHSVDLLGKFEAQATAELLGKADITHSVDLLGKAEIQQSGSAELLCKTEIQHSTELLCNAIIKNVGSAILYARAEVGQDNRDLFAKFEAQDTQVLYARVVARQADLRDLYARAEVGQGSVELFAKTEVGQGSVELLGGGIFRNAASSELKGTVDITHSVDLLGGVDITHSVELLCKANITHSVDLLGKFEAQATAELLGKAEIQQSDSAELLGNGIIRHSDTAELLGKFETQATAELLGKAVVRNIGSTELPAIFWIRQPFRLWTNRRYINGVVELTETLIGNAILEYVIEGVMQDIQSYLINAGLDYSEWTDIVLTPKLIRRATTYGTVAALYARRAKTFATRVIPTMAPVTLTTIGDEERAMNHWRDKMNQMLEFYVTSQGGDVMLTSTSDEEPVFSTEDIPPELTDYTPWYEWLMRRTQ